MLNIGEREYVNQRYNSLDTKSKSFSNYQCLAKCIIKDSLKGLYAMTALF